MKNFIITFKLPLILVFILGFSFFMGPYVPLYWKRFFFALSVSIKDALVFALPFIIFSFIFGSLTYLKERALAFIVILVPVICFSNFCSTLIAYGVGLGGISVMGSLSPITPKVDLLQPLWHIAFPKTVPNDVALVSGLLMGVGLMFLKPNLHEQLANQLMRISFFILKKLFIPLIPLFILGFGLQMEADDSLEVILRQYPRILLIISVSVMSYVIFLYFAGHGFTKRGYQSLKNMTPALLTGFSAMSSAAAMPLTILATEKNLDTPLMSRVIIPSTVNIHLMGDCFAIPIFALGILMTFGQPLPSLEQYLTFALFFVMAKFAVAAVPGGGILVMIPILEKYLNFDSTMISLITALYIMFDPIITSMNILGNGAFAIGFEKLFSRIVKGFYKTTALKKL